MTDTWAQIPDFNWKALCEERWKVDPFAIEYEASSLGRIRNKKTGKLLKQCLNQCGYMCVGMKRNTGKSSSYSVHTVVLETFTGITSQKHGRGITCDHKDGNKLNNCLSNLEWVSHKENTQRALKSGLLKHNSQPILCVETNQEFSSISEAARQFGISMNDLTGPVQYGTAYKGFHFKKLSKGETKCSETNSNNHKKKE